MNKNTEATETNNKLIFLFLLSLLVLASTVVIMTILILNAQHMACTNTGNVDMAISTWELLATAK